MRNKCEQTSTKEISVIRIKSGLTGLAPALTGESSIYRQIGTAMTRYGQIGWRMVAVVAFVGTAALAVVLTRAPIRAGAALSSEITEPACPTSGLEAWLGLGLATAVDPAAGTGMQVARGTYYTLEFTNVSDRACSLYGYPEVSVYPDEPGDRRPDRQRGDPRYLGPAEAGDARARSDGALRAAGHRRRWDPASRLRAGDRRGTAGYPAASGPVRVRSRADLRCAHGWDARR